MTKEEIEEIIADMERRATAANNMAKYYKNRDCGGSKADRDANVARVLGKATAYAHDAQNLRDALAESS